MLRVARAGLDLRGAGRFFLEYVPTIAARLFLEVKREDKSIDELRVRLVGIGRQAKLRSVQSFRS